MKPLAPNLRSPERLERQFIHTKNRMVLRYGVMISRTLYDRMCADIRTGRAPQITAYKRNPRFVGCLVDVMGRRVAVSYDMFYETVASALPPKIIPKLEFLLATRKAKEEKLAPPSAVKA